MDETPERVVNGTIPPIQHAAKHCRMAAPPYPAYAVSAVP